MSTPRESLDAVHGEVRGLRAQAAAREQSIQPAIDALPVAWRRSGANLAHYLALRAAPGCNDVKSAGGICASADF